MTEELEKIYEAELDKQKQATEEALKLKFDLAHAVEELELQAKVIVQLQQDVFELRKTVGNIFRVLKVRGWTDGTYVAGAVIK